MSQTGIVKYHIRNGNDAAADEAFNKLITIYSEQPILQEQIHYVARKYEEFERYDKALALYQYNVEHFPNDKYTMRSQVRIVRTYILEGDFTAADTAFDKLLTLFSDQPTLSEEVYKIANKFSEAGNSEMAHQLYQYVIDRWSSDVDINSRKLVVMSYIYLGLDAEVQRGIEGLIADFNDIEEVSHAMFMVGEQYFSLKDYWKAIDVWESVLTRFSNSLIAEEIPFLLGTC
jgi:tetratricopeptide (TPR) repeat protein